MQKVSIIGHGKVGKPMAEAFRKKVFNVVAIDKIAMPGATTDFKAILDTNLTFIIVPTPSKKDGSFSNKYIFEALDECSRVLGKTKHHFVISSTLSPGSMKEIAKKYDHFFCYNPMFIRQGSVAEDILKPDFVLIGADDANYGLKIADFYSSWECPVLRMNWINAEITKIALNTFTTLKMSFANNLGDLCEKISGANVDEITNALQLYHAIGKGNMTASVKYGGPCLPRDNKSLIACAKKYGIEMPLAKETDKINHERTKKLADLVEKKLPNGGKVLILGLAYKPNTELTEESAGIYLGKELFKRGIKEVVSWDKGINEDKDLVVLLGYCDVIVITNPAEEYKIIMPEHLKPTAKVIDCWRLLKGREFYDYTAIGINEEKML